jgi:hypothetical protein
MFQLVPDSKNKSSKRARGQKSQPTGSWCERAKGKVCESWFDNSNFSPLIFGHRQAGPANQLRWGKSLKSLAGAPGFEPGNGGIKIRGDGPTGAATSRQEAQKLLFVIDVEMTRSDSDRRDFAFR